MHRQLASILLIAMSVTNCSHRSGPLSPTPATTGSSVPQTPFDPASRVQSGSSAVRGLVTDGSTPIAGANVNAWVQQAGFGYSYMWAHGARLTDPAGKFELSGLPSGVEIQLEVWKTGYVQQCAAPPVVMSNDVTVDAQLVAIENISSSNAPSPTQNGFRAVIGTVVEVVNGEKRPIPSAIVDYEPIMDSPAAITHADSQGRFLLCGIPEDRPAEILASRGSGKVGDVTVAAGVHTPVEIVVP